MSDSTNINNDLSNVFQNALSMVERQPSADVNISNINNPPQPTQEEQFQILSQLNLPLSIPPPPAAFQIQPNNNNQSLNAAAQTFNPQPTVQGFDPVCAQISALQQAQSESMAKLQLLSYQLNSLNVMNQSHQSVQSLNHYQSIYQQYQSEFAHQMILNQYLANIKPMNMCNIPLLNDTVNDEPLKNKLSQLETIEEGENEEEAMEDIPTEVEAEDSEEIIVQMTQPTETEKIGESMGNYWKFRETNSQKTITGEANGEVQKKLSEFEQIRKQIRGILNKITPENFNKLSNDIASILKVAEITPDSLSNDEIIIAQKAQFKALIKLILKCILEKAIKESLFSNEYARLCYSLYLFVEHSELKKKIFRQCLLSLCHSVFKKARSKVESFEFLGIIGMIGDLFIYGLISWNVIHSGIFDQLLPPQNALDIEAVCKLLKTAGNDFDRHHFADINLVISNLKRYCANFDFRIQCLVKEIDEMRQNDWNRKIKMDAPMTLNQIHKEFNKENKHKKVYKSSNKRNVGNNNSYSQRWRPSNSSNNYAPKNTNRWRSKYNNNNHRYHGNKRRNSQSLRPSVEFVQDVTLPDRSHYAASKCLTKTWAMRNSGDLSWGDNVELVYFKGDRSLSLEDRYPVINAAPGQEVEISASIRTPAEPGRYCTYFRLQKNGQFFGPRVWVDLIVSGNGFGSKPLDGRKNCATNKEGKKWNKLLPCQ